MVGIFVEQDVFRIEVVRPDACAERMSLSVDLALPRADQHQAARVGT